MLKTSLMIYKKRLEAFTLAEVLITIGIIGVVAAMTLPSLINETRNKQHVVAFKKLYSNFSNAINLYKINEGCDGIDVATCIESMGYGDNNCDAFTEVAQNMKYVAMANGGASTGSWVPEKSLNYYGDEVSNGYGMINKTGVGCFYALSDGMVLNVDVDPNAFKVVVDTNGKKGPNRMGKDVHAFTVGCGDMSAELISKCIDTQKDVFPFISGTFPEGVKKGLCTLESYLDGGCSDANMYPDEGDGASPSMYILTMDKLPDYREIAGKVSGFKP